MATLLSKATGDFTAAGTWSLCDVTSELDSEASTTNVSTTNLDSATFTPGVITVDGIAIKISSIITPTGTLTVTLRNSTGSLDVASVTINASDLDANANGWVFFKFGSSQLLLAATAYLVRVVRSVADSASNRITLFRNATSNNHTRQVRTTTTQAPATTDHLIAVGEYTGAGTSNIFTVTMNDTSSTSYGATTQTESIFVGAKCTMTFGTAASTAYTLKWKGVLAVRGGGTLNTGTIATPMPSGSTATLTMDVVANVDSGLVIGKGGTWNGRGNALSFVKTLLASDAAAAATSLTTVDSTGWLNNDSIALAPTTRTSTQSEKKALTANASGTTLTIAALTNAHSGTNDANGDIRAELGNLTRNVVVTGTSTTLQGYVFFDTTAIVDIQYLEFNNLGSGTANKRGIDVAITTGSLNFQYNSVHDFIVSSSVGLLVSSVSGNNLTISNNVVFNTLTGLSVVATSAVHVFDSNLFIANIVSLLDAGCTFTNNTIQSSTGQPLTINEAAALGTFSGNVVHSSGNTAQGIVFSNINGGTASNLRVWRSGWGVTFNFARALTVDGLIAFGNTRANVQFGVNGNNTGSGPGVILNNLTLNAGVTTVASIGIMIGDNFNATSGFAFAQITNSVLGETTAHATGDLFIQAVGVPGLQLRLSNVKLASSNEIDTTFQSKMRLGDFVASTKHNQTAGSHRTFFREGTIATDTTISRTASPSARHTPRISNEKLSAKWAPHTGLFHAAVLSGSALTVQCYVRESLVSAGDAATYNGTRARLIVLANPAVGINADTVLATATAASSGAWEILTGTTIAVTDDGVLEFIVDCDGTAGWVNVDDFAATAGNQDTSGLKYWLAGTPMVLDEPDSGGVSSGGFVIGS